MYRPEDVVEMDPELQQALYDLKLWEMEERKANRRSLTSYACPCKKCMGGRSLDRKTIRKHLPHYKRDPKFTKSILICPSHLFPPTCIAMKLL
jgi:hypothetical protein